MARHPARADYCGYYVSAHAAVKATVAAEQKRHVSVRVVLNGGRHVVDLNIAGRLADISRAGLPVCRRSRRCQNPSISGVIVGGDQWSCVRLDGNTTSKSDPLRHNAC